MTTTPSETDNRVIADADARLLPALRALAENQGPSPRVFTQLFQVVLREFEPLVARRDYRAGALTRNEIKHRSSLKSDDARRLADEYLADPLVDVQCGRRNTPRIDSHRLGRTQLHSICVPVLDLQSGDPEGAIGLLLDGSYDRAASVAQQLMTLATVATSLSGAGAVGVSSVTADQNEKSEQLEGLARSSSFQSVREFAYTLVGSLCSRFRCEQVAFGIVKRQRVEVLAVSGLAEIKANSPGVIAIRQAMEECVDHDKALGWQMEQRETGADGHIEEVSSPGLLHRQWAHSSNHSAVLSAPLRVDAQTVGVVSFRRDIRHPFSADERLQIERLCARFGAPVRLIESASRSVGHQIVRNIGNAARGSLKRGAWGRWIVLAALIVTIGWFSAGTTQFHPRCTCEVTPESTIHFTAPYQGKLGRVHVHAGEDVVAGQLLAEFETRELRLQFESLVADLTAREVDVRKALQDNNVEEASLYQAQADVLRTQALGIENQLQRARLLAPEDGRIIQCDSRQLTGQVLDQGDPVLQFAPHGGFVLNIHVPDGIATNVKAGQAGIFASAARPDIPLPFRIRRVNSAAEVVNGTNVFEAEAELTTSPEWLKAGMQGSVRIDGDIRPVWWVTTHSVLGWLRMRFWL